MKIIVLLLLLICNCHHIFGQITRERKVGDDGFVWYKVKKGGLYGAEDSNGKTIIPSIYKYVYYSGDRIYRRYSHQKGVFVVRHPKLT